MNSDPAAAHLELRRGVRDFAESVVKPLAPRTDREHRFPEEALSAAAELDLMGILVPSEYGGAGLDHVAFAICVEEIARVCASTAVLIDVHNSVAAEPIVLFGTEEQKRTWLPKLANGELVGAFALTEPSSGSDAASLKTTARRDGDHYILSGTKVFITGIGRAGMYLVFARTRPDQLGASGVSCFIVPAGSPGLRMGQMFKKMGLNGSPTGELVLDEVRIPAANLLHQEGKGFAVAMRALDSGRIGISAQALGIGQAALEDAVSYSKQREQFGQPVATFEGLTWLLADMATQLEAARQLVYHAADLCSRGQAFTKEASMAKVFTTDAVMAITTDAIQIAGGYGYIEDYPFERYFRDAKACQIYEGSNQIQRIVIAREILR
ncbi:MAG: acyl-CoA dehydrogenase family protein [Candidatus Dormibacteraeota bacterium]|nr:acyl-CoA dehydrogenase family protein [Candidatus Dormibacteraeota bacterium]